MIVQSDSADTLAPCYLTNWQQIILLTQKANLHHCPVISELGTSELHLLVLHSTEELSRLQFYIYPRVFLFYQPLGIGMSVISQSVSQSQLLSFSTENIACS